jgi:hypothetical protein
MLLAIVVIMAILASLAMLVGLASMITIALWRVPICSKPMIQFARPAAKRPQSKPLVSK